jgi:hypothetical protein
VLFISLAYAGAFVFRSDRGTETKNIFLNVLLSILLCLSLYSVVICQGVTLNSLLLIILAYLVYSNYKVKQVFIKPNINVLIKLAAIFPVIVFIIGYYVFPNNIENDIRFYSKISYCLGKFGQENVHHFYNSEGTEFRGTYPYHYTELWLNSLFAEVLHVPNLIALKYVTYPFLMSLIFVGFASFSHKNMIVGILVSFGISVFPLFILFNFKNINYYIYSDFWLRPNFIMYYLGILTLLIFIFERNYKQVLVMSLIVFTFSITLIPGLLAGMITFWLYLKNRKKFEFKQLISYTCVTALFLTSMAIFYRLSKTSLNLIPIAPLLQLINENITNFRGIIGISFILIMEAMIIPILTYLTNRFVFKFEIFNGTILLVIISTIASILFFQFFNHIDNAYQFPYFSYCFATVVLIIFILRAINNLSVKAQIAGVIIFAFCTIYILKNYHTISLKDKDRNLSDINLMREGFKDSEVDELRTFIHQTSKGSYAFCKEDLENYGPKRRQSMVVQLGSYLLYVHDNSNQYLITCKEILLSDRNKNNQVVFEKLESWLRFYPKYSINCDLIEQLAQNGFNYLVVSKEYLLPDSITKSPNKLIKSAKYQILILSKNG